MSKPNNRHKTVKFKVTTLLIKGELIMKKMIATLLSLALCLSLLAGCTGENNPNEDQPNATGKDYSEFSGIVADPKTWYDEFLALPIANDSMTEDELRQLCADAFRANLSFQWTPTKEITFVSTLLNKASHCVLPTGIAYSGLCYATGIDNATGGTLWKVLPYYDPNTGALDVEAMGNIAFVLNNLSSACANGVLQGWNRVSNSHNLNSMGTFNTQNSNIVLVGPYTYDGDTYHQNFGSETATKEIIDANGEQVMYQSFAQMKMADGLYSASVYHVMMCAENPVVVTYPNGTIDPDNSYVLTLEQRQAGTQGDTLNYTQSNGVTMRPLGTVDNKYTFKQLLNQGYIPFTIKEFIGEDPVEPGEAWLGDYTNPLESNTEMTANQIFTQTVYANYNICNLLIEVKSPDGTVLSSYYPRVTTDPRPPYYEYSLRGLMQSDMLTPYADGSNTIHINVRLSNGELIDACHTVLKMS